MEDQESDTCCKKAGHGEDKDSHYALLHQQINGSAWTWKGKTPSTTNSSELGLNVTVNPFSY